MRVCVFGDSRALRGLNLLIKRAIRALRNRSDGLSIGGAVGNVIPQGGMRRKCHRHQRQQDAQASQNEDEVGHGDKVGHLQNVETIIPQRFERGNDLNVAQALFLTEGMGAGAIRACRIYLSFTPVAALMPEVVTSTAVSTTSAVTLTAVAATDTAVSATVTTAQPGHERSNAERSKTIRLDITAR